MATQQLVRDVILRDGSTLRLRAPRPEDLEYIKAFYDMLSPESRYTASTASVARTWRRAPTRRLAA